MAQLTWAVDTLSEELSLLISTHIRQFTTSINSNSQRIQNLCASFYICIQLHTTTHTHTHTPALCDQDVDQGKCSLIAGGSANLCNTFEINLSVFLKIWNNSTSRHSTSGLYIKVASPYHKHTCSTLLISSLFIRARNYKQQRCSPTQGWKLWYIYTIEYYEN
jgi:hypothetical protein